MPIGGQAGRAAGFIYSRQVDFDDALRQAAATAHSLAFE